MVLLKVKDVEIAGLLGHDSYDKSIVAFKQAFGDVYVNIRVGEAVEISK